MIRYVQRNEQAQLTGSYAQLQPGYAEEAMDENNPEHVTFMAQLAEQAAQGQALKSSLEARIAALEAKL